MRLRSPRRDAATAVEFAVVAPVAFLMILGIAIGGMGVFRYQQVAHLARDASRWASVHGTSYAADTGNTAATATDVYDAAIKPRAAGLSLSKLNYSVNWNSSNSPSTTKTVNGSQVTTANTVTVTVTYNWVPEAYLGGVTLSSSSTSVMQY
jgi:Flp pilus assembly protein TadG